MEFEWEEAKRLSNLAKHGLDFADVGRFDWYGAIMRPDRRFDYGESRFLAFGLFEGRLHAVTFTLRARVTRILNFRRASRKERRDHGA